MQVLATCQGLSRRKDQLICLRGSSPEGGRGPRVAKLALEARDFECEARDTVASGSSEALRRLRRVETRFYKLEDAYYKHVRDLDLERDSSKSSYGVKVVDG